MLLQSSLESRVQELGHQLFAQVRNRQHKAAGWWHSKLFEHALKDEALKVQLFRFVDVLPTLKDNKQIARHLEEYFHAPGQHFPAFLGWGVSLAGATSLSAAVAAAAIHKTIAELAHTFICGRTPAEAVRAVAAYRGKNLAATLDQLGEAVVSEPEAEAYFQKYCALLDELARAAPGWPANPQLDDSASGPLPRINLSLKLSSLYSQLDPVDPRGCERGLMPRLEALLDRAIAAHAFLNIDMEDYRLKDLTLRIFKDVAGSAKYRHYRHLGIVLQAYLKDSERDLAELAAWAGQRGTPVTVRLVKGAYWDYETIHARQHGWTVPVFTAKSETDASFERLSRQSLDTYPRLEAAFGSHNIRSLAAALALAEERQVSRNGFELQALYGMAEPLKQALAADGYRVRVYMPFGELLPGMAYLVRRLLENTANESFLRQGFLEGVSEEQLLAAPAVERDGEMGGRGDGEKTKGSGFRVQGSGSETRAVNSPITDDRQPTTDNRQPIRNPQFVNEPDTAFYTEAERAAFQKALVEVRKQFGLFWPALIGEREEAGQDGEIVSLNPSLVSEIVGRAARTSIAQADAAVAAARDAFPAWRDAGPRARAEKLRRAAALMRRRKFELAAWEVLEAGKPWREADGDVAEAIDFLEYYAREAERLMPPRSRAQVPGEVNTYLYQPRGVAVIISPWNFPLAILTGMSSAALAAGNTIILKPPEPTPIIAALLAQIYRQAGVSGGAVNYLPGSGGTVGAHLVTHPAVNLIAFTGSKEVGLWINAEAAKTRAGQQGVKKVICEMGGKNAIIVDEDADLDEAVLGVVQSAFGYAGQKCSACSRAIAVGTAYEPFLKRLLEAAASLKVAPAEDPGCRVPPLIDTKARQRVLQYIELGKQEAQLGLAVNVDALAAQGTFVGPVIFYDVPPTARIAQEEIFGPVLCVMRAADFDAALRIALDVPFALTGGLYSRSPAHIARARDEFRVGDLYINRGTTGAKVNRQPFGGFKMSGIGSQAGGPDYLLQFLEPRTVTENTLRRGFAPETADERE